MNKNNLFKAVQAAYELTSQKVASAKISKDNFVKSIQNDIFENAFVILLNDNIQLLLKEADLRLAPSIYCSARMIIEDLAILKGLEIGLINEKQMIIASLSQDYRFNQTQARFIESDLKVPNKSRLRKCLEKDKDQIIKTYSSLRKKDSKDLYDYQCYLTKNTISLIGKTLGNKYIEYRNICSFFVHYGLLDEDTDAEVLKIGSNVIDILLCDVERIILKDFSNINNAKYKSFRSYVEKMGEKNVGLKEIDSPWYYMKESFRHFAVDRYCLKRERAICLDFKLCQMFNLQKSICKRSKSFIEFASLTEYLLGMYSESKEKYERLEEFCRVSSYLRLSRIISDYEFVEKLKIDKKCYELYIKYFKDDDKMSYTKMIDKLLLGSVSFLDVKEPDVSIVDSVYKFINRNAKSKIDRWLFGILFKAGNKTDHFTGGYANYYNEIIDYWARTTYLNTLLIPYSLMSNGYMSGKAVHPEMNAHFIDVLSTEIMKYGGDEFFCLDGRDEHLLLHDLTEKPIPGTLVLEQPEEIDLDLSKVPSWMIKNKK